MQQVNHKGISKKTSFSTSPSLIITSFIKDPYRELRTPFNFFAINLAISDLIVGCITEPLSIVVHVQELAANNTNQIAHLRTALHYFYFVSVFQYQRPFQVWLHFALTDFKPFVHHSNTEQKFHSEEKQYLQ